MIVNCKSQDTYIIHISMCSPLRPRPAASNITRDNSSSHAVATAKMLHYTLQNTGAGIFIYQRVYLRLEVASIDRQKSSEGQTENLSRGWKSTYMCTVRTLYSYLRSAVPTSYIHNYVQHTLYLLRCLMTITSTSYFLAWNNNSGAPYIYALLSRILLHHSSKIMI